MIPGTSLMTPTLVKGENTSKRNFQLETSHYELTRRGNSYGDWKSDCAMLKHFVQTVRFQFTDTYKTNNQYIIQEMYAVIHQFIQTSTPTRLGTEASSSGSIIQKVYKPTRQSTFCSTYRKD